jgi:parallel beta-helix repeat protein
VRGNTLLGNAVGIEVSGGERNHLEFNAAHTSLGSGIEIASSGHNTVFGNTTDNNLQEGIWVEEAIHTDISGNAARWNGGDGLNVDGDGSVVRSNLAMHNHKWGIYTTPGVVDGRGNGASGNAEAAQCYLIVCADGSDWRAPVRPPEPLDPLEAGLPALSAVGPGTAVGPGSAVGPDSIGAGRPRNARVGVVRCKWRRATRGADDLPRGRKRARAVCRAPYRARRGSRRLAGRLVRNGESFAWGARRVRAGRPGRLAMLARRRPRMGRYTLLLHFRDARHHTTVVRRPVRVR